MEQEDREYAMMRDNLTYQKLLSNEIKEDEKGEIYSKLGKIRYTYKF